MFLIKKGMHHDAKSTEAVGTDGVQPGVRGSAVVDAGQFSESLNHAELLLHYAAETGVEINAGIREKILRAAAAGPAGCDQGTVADLLLALTELSARLKPVTIESLKACKEKKGARVLKFYMRWSIALAIIIVVFSLWSYVTSALSKSINARIDETNQLAATLRTELITTNSTGQDASQMPAGISAFEVTTQLQTYASNIREIYARSTQLNRLIFDPGKEYRIEQVSSNPAAFHAAFQLPVPLTNFWQAEQGRTALYQHVRSYADTVTNDVSLIFGAALTCILPVLYALFGTCAYFLRNYEQQMRTKTFVPSSSDSAHFMIAAICGAVIGLFNVAPLSQEMSVPPLAIAFLAGYGVDVFFSYLELILQRLKGKDSSGTG